MVKMTETNLQDLCQSSMMSDATHLECQVAGHSATKGKSLGFMRHKDGYVLKPVFSDKEQGRREIEFYEELDRACDPVTRELKKFVPRYFGTTEFKGAGDGVKWLVLKNLIHEFKEPCVMDIKVGARTWDPLATEEKRISEEGKYRECKRDLGFCIPGFQVYQLPGGELLRRDRTYGKSLDGKTAKTAIRTFLNADFGLNRSLVLQFLAKLWKILRWFRTQTQYRFYSSSLLLVYDAARLKQILRPSGGSGARGQRATIGRQLSLRIATGPLTPGFSEASNSRLVRGGHSSSQDNWHKVFDNVCRTHSLVNNYDRDLESMRENYNVVLKDLVGRMDDTQEVWTNVCMIDFAHVFHSTADDVDRNYLTGLQSLVNIFEDFLREAD